MQFVVVRACSNGRFTLIVQPRILISTSILHLWTSRWRYTCTVTLRRPILESGGLQFEPKSITWLDCALYDWYGRPPHYSAQSGSRYLARTVHRYFRRTVLCGRSEDEHQYYLIRILCIREAQLVFLFKYLSLSKDFVK